MIFIKKTFITLILLLLLAVPASARFRGSYTVEFNYDGEFVKAHTIVIEYDWTNYLTTSFVFDNHPISGKIYDLSTTMFFKTETRESAFYITGGVTKKPTKWVPYISFTYTF